MLGGVLSLRAVIIHWEGGILAIRAKVGVSYGVVKPAELRQCFTVCLKRGQRSLNYIIQYLNSNFMFTHNRLFPGIDHSN